jgi:hypothetical protein
MPPLEDSSESPRILFCPFCRDAFEGCAECPEHELTLVAIDQLPRTPERALDSVTFFVDPRLGRGLVLLGATLILLGFVAPFVSARAVSASALEVAIDGAGNLWLTPGAALALVWILWRRRSRDTMRTARFAVLGLALGGALPLIYTTRRIGLVADAYTADVEWLWGLWLMVAGLLVAALGSRRIGRWRARRRAL